MLIVFVSKSLQTQRLQLYPETDANLSDVLQEAGEYLIDVEGLDQPDETDLIFDDLKLDALRSPKAHAGRWLWKIGFYAGDVEFTLVLPGGKRRVIRVTVSADKKKLLETEFDTMLREIREDTYALFQMSGYRRAFATGVRNRPPPLVRLEYIRSRIEEIEKCVEAINRQPVRTVQKEVKIVPFFRTKHVDGRDISRSIGRERMLQAPSGDVLPTGLEGYYPIKLRQRQPVEATNIREHRQIKGCLLKWGNWLILASKALRDSSDADKDEELGLQRKRWAKRSINLSGRLLKLVTLETFQNIEPMYNGLSPSYIFLRRPAYRKFFRLASNMDVGISDMFGDFLELPLKRTFDLYELWVYLRLVRAALFRRGISDIAGREVFDGPTLGVTLRGDQIRIDLGNGIDLCFQKTFVEYWRTSTGVGTFTHPMRPDITLVLSNEKRLIVIDAKYRVGPALNDAIASIHTYRDALLAELGDETQRVVAAGYIVSPFRQVLKETEWKKSDMPMRLFHPQFRGQFKFGGISMVPGSALKDVGRVFDMILEDATS